MRHLFHAAQRGFLPPVFAAAGGPEAFGPGPRGFGGRDVGPGPRGFGPGRRGFGPGPWGFGPDGPRARRGDVRSAILGLLAEGPSNGYGLIKAIAERTDGAWQPSPGSVYPTLASLVDEGLVSKSEEPRGSYALTEAGKAYVEENRESVDAAFENGRGEAGGGELREAVHKLMGSVAQFRGAGPDQQARATEKIDQLRRELYAILAE